jgi:hypothetical protein
MTNTKAYRSRYRRLYSISGGHAYEFDIYPERWELFEQFLKMISGKDDIFCGTNKEVLLPSLYL